MARTITGEVNAVVITPTMALRWLEKNTRNRKINQSRVEQYSRAMKNGEWEFTGDSIKFSKEGDLLDGQHRLWACIEAKKSFPSAVVMDLPGEVMTRIDVGMPRTRGSVLKIRGEKHARILGAALYWIWKMERGRQAIKKRALSPTHEELLAELKARPQVRGIVEWLHSFGPSGRVVGATGQLAAVCCLLSETYPLQAKEFFAQLYSGANCSADAPALALRNRLMHAKLLKQKITQEDVLTLTAYAWKGHIKGKTMKKISPRRALLAFVGGPNWDAQEDE